MSPMIAFSKSSFDRRKLPLLAGVEEDLITGLAELGAVDPCPDVAMLFPPTPTFCSALLIPGFA